MKALPVIAVALFALTGCTTATAATSTDTQTATATQTARPSAEPEGKQTVPPVPMLKAGQPAVIDLFGDGQATITVAGTEVSKLDDGNDRLVVTVDILLSKAGKPITGGPENFRFRDKDSGMHTAQTDEQSLPPRLPSMSFTTTGQSAHGRLYFDVPAGSAAGGHIQLMTGALVHAVWTI